MKSTLIALLMLIGSIALAQTNAPPAVDFFNAGSATYIRDTPERALAIVNEGLNIHPQDEKLLKLKELLEKKQDEQKKDQDQEQQKQEQPQDQQNNDSKPDDQDQQQQEEEKEQDEEKQDQNEEKDKPEPGEEEKPEEEKEASAGDMTEQEAEMVLDSLRQLEEAQREQMTQEMIRRKMHEMPPVDKDW